MKAKHLRILVIRDGQEKANVSMPAATAKWFIDFISDDLLEKIKERGIDLESIQANLKSQEEIHPQKIFELNTEEKNIRVWLE